MENKKEKSESCVNEQLSRKQLSLQMRLKVFFMQLFHSQSFIKTLSFVVGKSLFVRRDLPFMDLCPLSRLEVRVMHH